MQSRFSGKQKKNLTRLASLPTTKDLEFLYSEATKLPGMDFEVTFSKGGENYFVVARFDRRNGDEGPEWTFKRGNETSATVEWVYQTKDLAMISTLISTAFPDEDIAADANQSMFMASKANDAAQPMHQSATALKGTAQASGEKGALQGDLTKIALDTLLQSIASGKMTGRLELRDKARTGEVCFRDGVAYHAKVQDLEGDAAIVELVAGWHTGEFWFLTDQLSDRETVQKRLESLLMQAATLMDHSKVLEKYALRLESRVTRANPNLTEQEFESRVAGGVQMEMLLQKRVYQAIGNGSTLLEILRRIPMSRSDWAAVFYNFVTCGLVHIDNQQQKVNEPLYEVEVDTAALDRFVGSLKRADTGVFTQMPFMFLMEREYFRYHCYQVPFSIVLMRLSQYSGGDMQPLTIPALKEAIARIDRCRRATDLVAHFETFDMALLLPQTDARSARGFAGRLVEMLYAEPLVSGMDISELSIQMGIASMPEDGTDLRFMLQEARRRRELK